MTPTPLSPLNGVPETMRHGEGAYARCFYCRRYSLDPNTLSDDARQPVCDCGKQHGWSGSFEKPGPDAVWSGRAPQPVSQPGEGERSEAKRLRPPSAQEPWVVADDTGVRRTFRDQDSADRWLTEHSSKLVRATITFEPGEALPAEQPKSDKANLESASGGNDLQTALPKAGT